MKLTTRLMLSIVVLISLLLSAAVAQVIFPVDDSVNASIANGNTRTTTWRMYDFFEEPFADFWDDRIISYDDEQILHKGYPNVYACMLGNGRDIFNYPPNQDYTEWYQLSAPYRINITATDVKEWNTTADNALILPIMNNKPGALTGEIMFNWYWQYYNTSLWQSVYQGTHPWNAYYNIPVHAIYNPSNADGWYGYLKSQISFDRDAAEKYLDGPKSGDLINWYNSGNTATQIQKAWYTYWYETANYQWDIWPAYEWTFDPDALFNVINMTLSTSDRLVIDSFMGSWGWEAVMSRILEVGNVSPHFQVPWTENATFCGKINASGADIYFDGVAQYSLTGWGYKQPGYNYKVFTWMIETSHADYVSSSAYGLYPPDTGWYSRFENYSNTVNPTLTRECELPGTSTYGSVSSYWSAPERWNLSAGEQVIFELPPSTVDVLGFNPPSFIDFNDFAQMNLFAYWGNMTYLGGDLDANTVYDENTNTVTVTGPAAPVATYNTSIPGESILTRGFPAWYFGVYMPPDFDPPLTNALTIAYSGSGNWFVSNVTVIINSIDADGANGSGVDFTKYRIDGGIWTTYVDSFKIVDEGVHTLEFYSVDKARNTEATQSRTISIDKSPPTVAFIQSDGAIFDSSSVTIYWTASDSQSSISGFEFSLDGGGYESLGNATLGKNLTDLSEGNHYIILRAINGAGLMSEESLNFKVDTEKGSLSDPAVWNWILIVIIIVEAFVIMLLVVDRERKRKKPDT